MSASPSQSLFIALLLRLSLANFSWYSCQDDSSRRTRRCSCVTCVHERGESEDFEEDEQHEEDTHEDTLEETLEKATIFEDEGKVV